MILWSISLALSATSASAQITLSIGTPNLHAGKVGVGIDGISGSPDFLLKYFLSGQVAWQLILGADLDFPGGDPLPGQTKVTGLDLRGGLGLIVHLSQSQVSPYLGIEGVVESRKEGGFYTQKPDAKTIITARALFGLDYFFNESISIGIKQTLGGEFQLKRDVPKEEANVRVSTLTLLTGRFYFN